MSLSQKQRGVLTGMILAMCAALAAVTAGRLLAAKLSLPQDALGPRLRFGMPFLLLLIFPLMASIGNLARHRMFNPEDIDGSGLSTGTDKAKIFQSILQNTLEQLILAFGLHLLWLVLVPLPWLPVSPACALLFLLGRALFALGYAKGAPARAFGFASTFYPSILMFLLLLYHVVIGL